MYRSRRKRRAVGANGPGIRRAGSTVSRVGSSGDIEISRRSPGSVYGIFLGDSGDFQGGGRNVRTSAITRRDRAGWPQNLATRADGRSHRFFWGFREVPAIAGFGCRTHSRRKGGAVSRARVRNALKRGAIGANVPETRRPGSTASRLGSSGNIEKSIRSPSSPRGRFIGEMAGFPWGAFEMYESRLKRAPSVGNGPNIRRRGSMVNRIGFSENIEQFPAIAGFGVRTRSRLKGAIMRGRVGNARKSAKKRR